MNTEQSFTYSTFLQRENFTLHKAYSSELAFYHAVQSGDLKKVKKIMSPLDSEGFGRLSENPVRNLRYHLIVSIAMITRFCIEAGMPSEEAYTLSDLYIQKADTSNTTDVISSLHREMVFDYTNRMRHLRTEQVYSKPVSQCLDYIYNYLHTPLRLDELADYVNLAPSYLSALFKKQVGVSISAYIRSLRVDAAKNMLRYSEYSPIEVANYLCFSSHSYFIQIFKQETGLTPRQYQQRFFSRNWQT